MELKKHKAEILYGMKGSILFPYSMCASVWSVFALRLKKERVNRRKNNHKEKKKKNKKQKE